MTKTRTVALTPLERYLRALRKQRRAIEHAFFRRPVSCWKKREVQASLAADNEVHAVWGQLSSVERIMAELGCSKIEALESERRIRAVAERAAALKNGVENAL